MDNNNKLQLPLVTVSTMCYNTGKYVVEALESVKRQNYPNIQHIIIDDFSKDDSVNVIENWIQENNYPCTFIKHESNKGVPYNVKETLAIANGKYLSFISDDLWADNKLLSQVSLLENINESYILVYGDTNMIDKDGKILVESMFEHYRGKNFVVPTDNIFTEVVKDFYFFLQSVLMKLAEFRTIENLSSKEIISEDWDWQLWASRNYNCLGVNQIFSSYRWLHTSIGRTTWTNERMHIVLVSHIKMMLKYYHHPKNTQQEKKLIFKRVMRMYNELSVAKNVNKKQKVQALYAILKRTRNFKLLPILVSLYLFSKENYLKKTLGLN